MPMFRKRPVTIEARQLNGTPHEVQELAQWCSGTMHTEVSADRKGLAPYIAIATLEGTMRADAGDWIIRGVQGEFYPCKDDIFRATYEAVDA